MATGAFLFIPSIFGTCQDIGLCKKESEVSQSDQFQYPLWYLNQINSNQSNQPGHFGAPSMQGQAHSEAYSSSIPFAGQNNQPVPPPQWVPPPPPYTSNQL